MTQHKYYPLPYKADPFNQAFKKGGIKVYIIVAYRPLEHLTQQRKNHQEAHPPSPTGIRGAWINFRQVLINLYLERQARKGMIQPNLIKIDLLHRMRYGKNIIPIPAWTTNQAAQAYLGNLQKSNTSRNHFVLGVTHEDIQTLIDEKRYHPALRRLEHQPKSDSTVYTYHLDLVEKAPKSTKPKHMN